MNENEAMRLRDRIKGEFSWIHIDIQSYKPAGFVETFCTLWLWKNNSDALTLASAEEFERWKRIKRLLT